MLQSQGGQPLLLDGVLQPEEMQAQPLLLVGVQKQRGQRHSCEEMSLP